MNGGKKSKEKLILDICNTTVLSEKSVSP